MNTTNKLAKESLQIIHQINEVDEQIHRAEIDLSTIHNEDSRRVLLVYLNDLERKRERLFMLQEENRKSIECRLLYKKCCSLIGKLKTDEYLEEAFPNYQGGL